MEIAQQPCGRKPGTGSRPIDWYRARWEIELFFLILKEGCRIEALRLGEVERIENALALYLVVSWRINRLNHLGKSPAVPAVTAEV